jgi:hypothetical protein
MVTKGGRPRWMGTGIRLLATAISSLIILAGPYQSAVAGATLDGSAVGAPGQGRVALVVYASIYNSILDGLNQYILDLRRQGFDPIVYQYYQSKPAQLRSYLAGLYRQPEGLAGAVLIGRVSYALYEVKTPLAGYEVFPCDLYYMDLDGFWGDSTNDYPIQANNGRFDTHTGNLDLEIWVSRMKTDNLSLLGSETANLNNYFIKDHRYRTGALAPNLKVLLFLDDPFTYFTDPSSLAVANGVYGPDNTDLIMDPSQSTPDYFKQDLMAQSYEFVLAVTHGTVTGQDFYRCDSYDQCWGGSPSYEGRVYNSDYVGLAPPWAFYLMGACNVCNYTMANNMCGTFVFNHRDSGLFTVGTAKVGAAVGDEGKFIEMLGGSHPIGEAFRQSFNNIQDDPAYADVADDYFYGVNLIGDAALQIRMQLLDYDGDEMPNYFEQSHPCLAPETADGEGDADGDGLINREELGAGSDPCRADTDGDGLNDGDEHFLSFTDPAEWDTDHDRLPDGFEYSNRTNPRGALNPLDRADAGLDPDGDGNSNQNEYWNGSDPWTADPVPGRWDNPGCYYWGDADGDGVPAPSDLAKLRLEIAGTLQTYPGILPHGSDTLDLDRDGNVAPSDWVLLSLMVAGAERPGGYPSQAAALEVVAAPMGSVAEGSTTHVTVSVHSMSGDVPYAPGYGVVFTVASGNAVLLGGDGTANGEAAGNRYDISMDAASGAKANIVVLVTGSGPITIGAKVPACGAAPHGRWNDEVVLSPEVTINP